MTLFKNWSFVAGELEQLYALFSKVEFESVINLNGERGTRGVYKGPWYTSRPSHYCVITTIIDYFLIHTDNGESLDWSSQRMGQ